MSNFLDFFLINSGDMEQYIRLKLMVLIHGSKPVISNSANVKVEDETSDPTKSTVPEVPFPVTKKMPNSELSSLSFAGLRSQALSSDHVFEGGSIENSPHLEPKTPDQYGQMKTPKKTAVSLRECF